MISSAYYIFIKTGAVSGPMDTDRIGSYILALTVYFTLNVLSVGLYYLLLIGAICFKL